MLSVLDMFSIGVGPSSSHTVGPMRAACAFVQGLRRRNLLIKVAQVRVTLYGSLAQTGLGHGTDRAVMAGLEGSEPHSVDTDDLLHIRERAAGQGVLHMGGDHDVPFEYERDVIFERWITPRRHPNGMRFEAFDANGRSLASEAWFSVGGGFVVRGELSDLDPAEDGHHRNQRDGDEQHDRSDGRSGTSLDIDGQADDRRIPFPFTSADELLAICKREQLSIDEVVWRNELAMHAADDLRAKLLEIWQVMRECVHHGCNSPEPVLPGGLDVARRAPKLYAQLTDDPLDPARSGSPRHSMTARASAMEWVDLFALAVSEENAGGGRIVTAPTNGSAGIIPAVLHYYWLFAENPSDDGVVKFLLTAGAVGMLFKRNASISGAEVGCQGEVGSACSMAAAGLCAVLGGTPEQVENAAEIGIEHHLGLTCDPIGGLVQIPCIERNAMAANTAINAARMAMLGNGSHIVSLDQAIITMKQTGADMQAKYKETSTGGLAVNVVEC